MSNLDKMGAIISMFVAQLGKHGKNWLKMWTANGMPLRYNGKPYTGINIFILWDAIARNKYKSNTFVTWKMVMGAGGRVKEDLWGIGVNRDFMRIYLILLMITGNTWR